MDMQISDNGKAFIKGWESCSLVVYNDAAGKPTIGWGHLLLPGEESWAAGGITQAQADQLFDDDLAAPQDAVNRLADPSCNQNQFDSLCSFDFNLGEGSLETMLAHGWAQVPAQIPRWHFAGGVSVPGLVNRRAAELALFQS
jgi:lysozyme